LALRPIGLCRKENVKASLWILVPLLVISVASAIALAVLLRRSVDQVSDREAALRDAHLELSGMADKSQDLKSELQGYKERVRELNVHVDQLRKANKKIRKQVDVLTADLAEANATPTSYSCGDLASSGAGIYNVNSVGVTCEQALDVVHAWENDVDLPDWSCSTQQLGIELFKASCQSISGGVVTFEYGA
jgi:TolA-binding protein